MVNEQIIIERDFRSHSISSGDQGDRVVKSPEPQMGKSAVRNSTGIRKSTRVNCINTKCQHCRGFRSIHIDKEHPLQCTHLIKQKEAKEAL